MPFVTKSEVLVYSKIAQRRRSMAADAILKEEATLRKATSYDVFLSHSYFDKEMILGTKQFIEIKGFTVYVDWIEDTKLDRTKVTQETANVLRDRMNRCKCLIYAYSPNIAQSRWCPWELGYFDGKNGKAYVMPIVDEEDEGYIGVEYVALYPTIVDEKSKSGKMLLYVHPSQDEYIPLRRVIKNC